MELHRPVPARASSSACSGTGTQAYFANKVFLVSVVGGGGGGREGRVFQRGEAWRGRQQSPGAVLRLWTVILQRQVPPVPLR